MKINWHFIAPVTEEVSLLYFNGVMCSILYARAVPTSVRRKPTQTLLYEMWWHEIGWIDKGKDFGSDGEEG